MAVQTNDAVYGRNGQKYILGQELIAVEEGRIYRVSGQNLAVKVFTKADPHTMRKISYMVNNPITDLTDDYGRQILHLAWPREILRDEAKHFVGYLMPEIRKSVGISTVAGGCNTPGAKATFTDYNWQDNLRTAANLARAVNYLHQRGCIIGDMDSRNILVSTDCSVTFLNTDRFDLTDSLSGIHYRCCTGSEDYLAPELLGRDLNSPSAVFSAHSDDFSLAIHIFRLLMNNTHPFSGKYLDKSRNSAAYNQRPEHMALGRCPFVNHYEDMTIPVGAPLLGEMMPATLVAAFRRTFDYDYSTVQEKIPERTAAAQWQAHLELYLRLFGRPGERVQCSADPRHVYLNQMGKCGLCSANQRLEDFRRNQAGAKTPDAQPRQAEKEQPRTQKAPPQQPAKEPPQNKQSQAQKTRTQQPKKPASTPPKSPQQKQDGCLTTIVKWMFIIGAVAYILILINEYKPSSKKAAPSGTEKPTVVTEAADLPKVTLPAYVPTPVAPPSFSGSDSGTAGNIGSIGGTWEKMEINGMNCGMLHLDTPIRGMTRMTVNFRAEPYYGATCKDWTVYCWIDGAWKNMGNVHLPEGKGSGSTTVTGDGTKWVEYIAVCPTKRGSYSWDAWIDITDIQQKQ